MRITFVLPGLKQVGGVRSTLELADRLQERGHRVMVIYPMLPLKAKIKPYDYQRVLGQGFQVYIAALRLKYTAFGDPAAWFPTKASVVMKPWIHPRWFPAADILVATWWEDAYHTARFPPEKGAKFYFVRGHENHIDDCGCGLEEAVFGSYRLPFHILTPSPHLKAIIETASEKSAELVPNGINLDLFYRLDGHDTPNYPRRIGMLYRKKPVKGLADAYAALSRLKGIGIPFEAHAIGERPPVAAFPLTYHGYLSGENLMRWYNSLDLFLWSSREEGFGNPPLEAMACGVPVVATRTGCICTHTVPGETALVCEPGDVQGLTDGMYRLLTNERKRRNIADAGYRHVQQFSWESTVDRLEHLFQQTKNAGNDVNENLSTVSRSRD